MDNEKLRNIGARKLQQSSIELESVIAKSKDNTSQLACFYRDFTSLLNELQQFSASSEPEQKHNSISAEQLNKEFKQLSLLLENGDAEALNYLEEIRSHLPIHTNNQIAQFEQAIKNYDFDLAIELLKAISK